mmetsp:Transcript_121514/g.288825  ORF Transcript_121514/g.288825 Transcript_121514/m.288825 type:complete len:226 (-) Transcript_121514:727-1404(-)
MRRDVATWRHEVAEQQLRGPVRLAALRAQRLVGGVPGRHHHGAGVRRDPPGTRARARAARSGLRRARKLRTAGASRAGSGGGRRSVARRARGWGRPARFGGAGSTRCRRFQLLLDLPRGSRRWAQRRDGCHRCDRRPRGFAARLGLCLGLLLGLGLGPLNFHLLLDGRLGCGAGDAVLDSWRSRDSRGVVIDDDLLAHLEALAGVALRPVRGPAPSVRARDGAYA